MANLQIILKGAEQLKKKLDTPTIKKPLDDGIKKIAYTLEGLIKEATVVGETGYLLSGTHTQITSQFAKVGTNVPYAPFVEYGTERMEARHMEGGTKRLGKGMFTYGIEQLQKKMGDLLKGIALNIEKKFGD